MDPMKAEWTRSILISIDTLSTADLRLFVVRILNMGDAYTLRKHTRLQLVTMVVDRVLTIRDNA